MKGGGGANCTVCLGGACEQKEGGEEMHLGWQKTIRG
jgi:hypothetical protein